MHNTLGHTTLGTTRLHLLLATAAALTGTTYGLAVGMVVLLVVALRLWARRCLAPDGSAPAGRGVLAPAQHPDLLHAAGGAREQLAG
jgi:hypothetical protein